MFPSCCVFRPGRAAMGLSCNRYWSSDRRLSGRSHLGTAGTLRRPSEAQSAARLSAVAQIEVHQRLVRNGRFLGQGPEIRDRVGVQANGQLLLETLRIRIAFSLREIVVLLHRVALK